MVVVIHGGFWKAEYDLSLGRPLAASLAAEGWAAWNLEYRRVGDGGAAGACRPPSTTWPPASTGSRDLDVSTLATVITLGHSAGGHLATWAASRGRFERWRRGVDVTGVVSQAGVLDLRAAHDAGLGGGAVEAFLGHPPTAADAAGRPGAAGPLDVPVRCVHGRDDDDRADQPVRGLRRAADGRRGERASWSRSTATTSRSSTPARAAWARRSASSPTWPDVRVGPENAPSRVLRHAARWPASGQQPLAEVLGDGEATTWRPGTGRCAGS